jgi:hypothetical protein
MLKPFFMHKLNHSKTLSGLEMIKHKIGYQSKSKPEAPRSKKSSVCHGLLTHFKSQQTLSKDKDRRKSSILAGASPQANN